MSTSRQHIDRAEMLRRAAIKPEIVSIDLRLPQNRNKYPSPNWSGSNRAERRHRRLVVKSDNKEAS